MAVVGENGELLHCSKTWRSLAAMPEQLRDDAMRAARELVHAAGMYRRGRRHVAVRVLLREATFYVRVARAWNREHVRRMAASREQRRAFALGVGQTLLEAREQGHL